MATISPGIQAATVERDPILWIKQSPTLAHTPAFDRWHALFERNRSMNSWIITSGNQDVKNSSRQYSRCLILCSSTPLQAWWIEKSFTSTIKLSRNFCDQRYTTTPQPWSVTSIHLTTRAAKPSLNGTTARKSLDQLGKSEFIKPNSGQDGGGGTLSPDLTRKKPGRGGINRPPSEETLHEREDPHFGKPALDRQPHLHDKTEEIILDVLHHDEARANLSRDTLKDLPGREDFQAVLVIATYLGKQYFKGTRTELSNKFIFESTDSLINLIKDESLMESTVSRRKQMPNELTRLIDFDGVLGDDVLMALNSATTLDERRSAMLVGLRRALLCFYGQTSETYAVYKTAESQTTSQLSQYFHLAQKFARQLIWPHLPLPRWNPPALPVRDYHTMKRKSSKENKSSIASVLKTSILEEGNSSTNTSRKLRVSCTRITQKQIKYDDRFAQDWNSSLTVQREEKGLSSDANKLDIEIIILD